MALSVDGLGGPIFVNELGNSLDAAGDMPLGPAPDEPPPLGGIYSLLAAGAL